MKFYFSNGNKNRQEHANWFTKFVENNKLTSKEKILDSYLLLSNAFYFYLIGNKKTNRPFYFQNIRKYKVKDDNREIAQRKRGTTLGLVFKKHSQIDAFSLINHELTGLVFWHMIG